MALIKSNRQAQSIPYFANCIHMTKVASKKQFRRRSLLADCPLQSGNQLFNLLFAETLNRTKLGNNAGTRSFPFCRVTERLSDLQMAVYLVATLLFDYAYKHTTINSTIT